MNKKNERGCVYFFKHIGLNPVKIGYSENESPINRFNQFRTYAPYGAELIGFIQSYEAKELETLLHLKYSEKRFLGEWFDISLDDVNKEIEFHSNIEDIKIKNEFQIAWAKAIDFKNNKKTNKETTKENAFINNAYKRELFFKLYESNKKLNKNKTATEIGVSRQCIYDWIEIFENNKKIKVTP